MIDAFDYPDITQEGFEEELNKRLKEGKEQLRKMLDEKVEQDE